MDSIKEIVLQIEALKSEQKFQEAIDILETSIAKHNNDYRLYEELADIYLYKGELDKAIKSINFALSLNSESAT
jgi:tetratricopeptide (TPR) repeat protein|tara:strand:+ start:345 stop:566 length:222 start_codon:yes stop_codon:yes gene_type:complete